MLYQSHETRDVVSSIRSWINVDFGLAVDQSVLVLVCDGSLSRINVFYLNHGIGL